MLQFKFTILLTTLVETLPMNMHEFRESESVVYFHRRCRLKFVLPYGPMLTKRKTKIIKKSNILKNKQQKNGLEIWWIGTFPQNLALIHLSVSEKTMSMAGRGTNDDGRPRYDILLVYCVILSKVAAV